MPKPSKEQKDEQEIKQKLQEKVQNYMGPAAADAPPEAAEAKGPGAKELLPSDKLPDLSTPKKQEISVPVSGASSAEPLGDKELSRAVDDIAAKESDQILKDEDDKKLAESFSGDKQSFGDKIKNFFKTWWGTPKYRKATLIGVGITLFVLSIIPPSRYFVLNSVGVRASTSVTILDESTRQPLKNVEVAVGAQSTKTDDNGRAELKKLKLGRHTLKIEKIAYAKIERAHTFGLGSNPLGEIDLTPTGAQYAFKITDFLSQKPVIKAEVINGESSAFANEEGLAILTIEKPEEMEVKISIEADGYRSEEITLNVDSQDQQPVVMAAGKKHVFVSKRSGKYDVYKIDADGKNEELLLAGTGSENDSMTLTPHPEKDIVAVVSTRENKRNKDKFLLSTLSIIDITAGDVKTVGTSEQIRPVGWFGERFVYVAVAEGTSAGNPKRHRLNSYDYSTSINKELAFSNYFNDVYKWGDAVLYSVASAYQPDSFVGLFKVSADGTNRAHLINQETWQFFRKDFYTLLLSVEQDWYQLRNDDSVPAKAAGPPSNYTSRTYVNNPDNSKALWIDERDGQGVLLAYDISGQKDDTITSKKGIKLPAVWLSPKHAVYRFEDGKETADYVVNIEGGNPSKIRDVTTVGSSENWYYY